MSFIGNSKIAARVHVYDAELRDRITELEAQVETAYADGQKSEYDRFWDSCQSGKGAPQSYATSFGAMWTVEAFRPKYNIVPTDAYMMFRGNQMNIDLVEHLESLGITLDFSKATNVQYIFQISRFTRVGVVDVTASTGTLLLDNTFAQNQSLETIDKIILPSSVSKSISNAFGYCTALKNVTFEGVIPQSINFQHSPLTTDSMINIIYHLKSFLNDPDNQFTQTLTFSEECWAALAERDEESPLWSSSKVGWRSLVENEYCWNT